VSSDALSANSVAAAPLSRGEQDAHGGGGPAARARAHANWIAAKEQRTDRAIREEQEQRHQIKPGRQRLRLRVREHPYARAGGQFQRLKRIAFLREVDGTKRVFRPVKPRRTGRAAPLAADAGARNGLCLLGRLAKLAEAVQRPPWLEQLLFPGSFGRLFGLLLPFAGFRQL
jgi:hypothetical protein